MAHVLIVAVMGGLGSVLRYGVGTFVQRQVGGGFPWGTFCVNVVGCGLAGVAAGVLARGGVREEVRLAVMAGFLGGFTTFSAFGVEAVGLVREGRVGWAAAYVAGSVGVGLLAVGGMYWVVRR